MKNQTCYGLALILILSLDFAVAFLNESLCVPVSPGE